MFCSECGKQATGKFCWNCGCPLHDPAGSASPIPSPTPTPPSVPVVAAATVPPPPISADWQNEIVYDTLVHNPEVRDILARQIPPASRMTGEDLLEAWGKISKSTISLAPAAAIAQEINSRMGIHTGKSRSIHYNQQIGRVIVSALCVLARDGYGVKEARQASDGCILICTLPSDMFSLAGTLVIEVRRDPAGVSVSATTRIEGQLMDWGKSNRVLDDLFGGIDAGI